MTVTVAQLAVKVAADTGGAEAKMGGLSGMFGKLGGIASVGVLAAGTALLGIGVASVKMAGDFQSGMTSLVTGAGESASNLKMVSAGILQMAVDTGTSTDQLTAGMYMIESAGYHGAAALSILKAAAEGAKVGNADLGVVSDATTTILNDFGSTGITASGAVNLLIATVASGKTHMQDLAQSLSQILPTASAAGIGLNDVMGAMATMTGEGVPAANAATYLRQTILALDAPSKTAVKAMESVGLSSTQVADEMKKSLPDALKMITDAVGKKFPIGSAQYVAAIKDISGGSKTMQGMLDLTGAHLATFQGNVAGVAAQVKKGGSSIVGWSEVQGDFNFQIDRAKEVVQTLMIKLGTGLLPILTQGVELLISDVLPAVMGFATSLGTSLLPSLMQVASSVMSSLLPVVKQLASFLMGSLIPTIITLVKWFVADVLPVLAQVVGIIVADVLPAVMQVASAILTNLLPPIKQLWNELAPKLVPILGVVGAVLKDVVAPALSVVITIVGKLLSVGVTLIGWIADAITWLVKIEGFFIGLEVKGIEFLIGGIGRLMSWFGNLKDKVVTAAINLTAGFINTVSTLPGKVLGFLGDMATKALSSLGNLKTKGIQAIADMASGFLAKLAGLPASFLNMGVTLIQKLISGITSMAGNLASSVANTIKQGVSNIPGVGGILSNIPGLAAGGTITTGGVVLVGEDGPELLKLPTGAQVQPIGLPSSLASFSQTAPASGQGQSSGGQDQTIILQIDGKTLGTLLLPYQVNAIRNAVGVRT